MEHYTTYETELDYPDESTFYDLIDNIDEGEMDLTDDEDEMELLPDIEQKIVEGELEVKSNKEAITPKLDELDYDEAWQGRGGRGQNWARNWRQGFFFSSFVLSFDSRQSIKNLKCQSHLKI